jgi:hypothetical protein
MFLNKQKPILGSIESVKAIQKNLTLKVNRVSLTWCCHEKNNPSVQQCNAIHPIDIH